MSAKRGTKGHADLDVVVRCFNPICGAFSEPGLKFCDECLTGMCSRKLSVFDMRKEVRRGDLTWNRGPVNSDKKN